MTSYITHYIYLEPLNSLMNSAFIIKQIGKLSQQINFDGLQFWSIDSSTQTILSITYRAKLCRAKLSLSIKV